jgi:hypothetical protein
MTRLRKNDPNYDASPEPSSDPTFDLRRGLVWLVIVIVVMVLLSLVCAFLR